MRAAALVALVLAVAFGAARPTAAAGGPFALERSSRALLVTGIIKESTEGVKSRGDTIAEHQKVVEEEITAVRIECNVGASCESRLSLKVRRGRRGRFVVDRPQRPIFLHRFGHRCASVSNGNERDASSSVCTAVLRGEGNTA